MFPLWGVCGAVLVPLFLGFCVLFVDADVPWQYLLHCVFGRYAAVSLASLTFPRSYSYTGGDAGTDIASLPSRQEIQLPPPKRGGVPVCELGR